MLQTYQERRNDYRGMGLERSIFLIRVGPDEINLQIDITHNYSRELAAGEIYKGKWLYVT